MSRYLRYVLRLMEPVRITDGAASIGAQTETMRYIPGSTVRGMVINNFALRDDFDELKEDLFSYDRCYLNAYLATKEHTLIPSPKGFYEDKKNPGHGEMKSIQNVIINGEFSDGLKRAGLGSNCYIEGGCIYYYDVATGSDLRIKINAEDRDVQSVFRNDYISGGQYFEGYIRLSGGRCDNDVCAMFSAGSTLRLGNGRSSSLGKCIVVESEITEKLPYADAPFEEKDECYIMLLSDTAMRSKAGEYCGIDCDELGRLLGVENLDIAYASTSTRTVNGYNRTLGIRLPSVKTYEPGSVFHLTYSGTINAEAMESVEDAGIGVRRNEGFGRVLFLKDYPRIDRKLCCRYVYDINCRNEEAKMFSESEKELIKTIANNHYRRMIDVYSSLYVVKNKLSKGGVKNSQLGMIESVLEKFRYDPGAARDKIDQYFVNALEKEENQRIQKEKATVGTLEKQIKDILNVPLSETIFKDEYPFKVKGRVMGIPVEEFFSENDEDLCKIALLIDMIRFDRKEGA